MVNTMKECMLQAGCLDLCLVLAGDYYVEILMANLVKIAKFIAISIQIAKFKINAKIIPITYSVH